MVWDRAPAGSKVGKAQQLVGRNPQRLAHLVNEREARLHFSALVARVAVLLDAEGFGEIAGPVEPALGSQRFQALRKPRTHIGRERLSHSLGRSVGPFLWAVLGAVPGAVFRTNPCALSQIGKVLQSREFSKWWGAQCAAA